MKGKYLILSSLALAGLSAGAQTLQADYIQWPGSSDLPTYVNDWKPGQELFPDENFFISRVRIKDYFRNSATQVYDNFTETNDKKLLFWVPVTYASWKGVHTDALPNGEFDSEVFSLWPYVTHYGDWTSPFGWVPGGFADAAHKHGTAVSGVASVPNATIPAAWFTCMQNLGRLDTDKLGQFLWFHGVDGLGYNSEWYGGASIQDGINKANGGAKKYLATKNPKFENIWYTGTEDSGSVNGFYDGLYGNNSKLFGDKDNVRTSLFLNYNWNSSSKYTTSQSTANSLGRDMHDLYAGFNMQGGAKTSSEWTNLQTWNYSIGLWGAHMNNYLWEGRNANGSAPQTVQGTYQKRLEQWFTNGMRNPIAKPEVYATTNLQPKDDWFGMSRFMTARSSLSWDLAEEPFVTFFNLGNGLFFNFKGERQHNSAWYNIGTQDYMPTWRFWQSDKFLAKEPSNIVDNGLNVAFTWDDAYMGGSSLGIKGSVADEYIHLFKTRFQLATNDIITVRYKVVEGSADISLALSLEGAEATIVNESDLKVLGKDDDSDERVWVEKTFELKRQLGTNLRRAPLAMIALHVQNAENLNLYLGEISIKRGTYTTPAAPEIKRSQMLANNISGIDAKVVFNMANSIEATGEPCYNIDVNTSLFRIYVQQEGKEPVNMGETSSWAAIAFAAPFDQTGSKRARIGVSAMNLDFSSESEIAWGEWQDVPAYVVTDDIEISQSIIKTDEPFSINYVDSNHAPSSWAIYDGDHNRVAYEAEATGIEVSGLPKTGVYDLIVNEGKEDEVKLLSYIQISSWEAGALPRILSMSVGEESVDESSNGITIKPAEELEFSYTGREADGFGSRGVKFDDKLVGMNAGEIGLQSWQSFSVAAWVRLDAMAPGIYSFMTIENRAGSWPLNNWGYFWCRINEQGYIDNNLIDGAYGGHTDSGSEGMRIYCDYSKSRITPMAWTHVCFVFEYNDSKQVRWSLYINGVKQTMSKWMYINKGTREGILNGEEYGGDWSRFDHSGANAEGENVTETDFVSTSYAVTPSEWISFGGTSQNINAMNGSIDNIVVWNKAVNESEVKQTMAGLDANNLPADVLGFWDFNTDTGSDYKFANQAKSGNGYAARYDHLKQDGEGQAKPTPIVPIYSAGCPFLEGKTYAITTVPTWTAAKGNISNAAGTATEGKATISFAKERDYNVTLKLENALGEDTRDYPVLTVSSKDAIEGIDNDNTSVYAVDKTVFVNFAEAGAYTVKVYNIAGELMNSRSFNASAGELAAVNIANPAVYIVNVVRNGETLRNVKVVVR